MNQSLAPAAVRAEVPTWLFQKVTIQYHDAARCSSRWRKRRRSICGSIR